MYIHARTIIIIMYLIGAIFYHFVSCRTGRIQRVLASGDDCSSQEIVLQNLDSPKAIVIEPFAG